MKYYHLAALAAAAVVLSGCATIVEGTTQSVSVNTSPADGAQCTLVNSQGTWYVTTPGSTTVHKTKTDLDVTCTKPGYQPGHVVATSHFGATTAANVIAGGVIGIGVDAASGANYHYDSPIMVSLVPESGGAQTPAATTPTGAPPATAPAAPSTAK
jgi:ABC-type Fe3+-hydroxamate transport system substrate-binding protein